MNPWRNCQGACRKQTEWNRNVLPSTLARILARENLHRSVAVFCRCQTGPLLVQSMLYPDFAN
jgi:hypothetical protein